MKVLFVCAHNAGRSQMGAAALRALRPGWEVRSAGVGPELHGTEVPPSVRDALGEVGLSVPDGTRRQLLDDVLVRWADVVVMLVEPARWPRWLEGDKVRYWPVADPRKRPAEVLRGARDEIVERVRELAVELDSAGQGTARATTGGLAVVCLPGFGDAVVGEQWVRELSLSLDGRAAVAARDWPGMWTRGSEALSFAVLVDEVEELAQGPDAGRTVLVGHSLGGVVAAQVAARHPVAGVVTLCSPAVPAVVTSGAAARGWRSTGVRPTGRRTPGGTEVVYQLPVRFLDELEAWLAPPRVPAGPVLQVFGGQDNYDPTTWAAVPRLGDEPASLVVPGSPHRFMDEVWCRTMVVGAVERFVAGLAR